jgi:hypothetical protein
MEQNKLNPPSENDFPFPARQLSEFNVENCREMNLRGDDEKSFQTSGLGYIQARKRRVVV